MVARGQLGLHATSLFRDTIYALGGYNNTSGSLSLIESFGGGHPWQGEKTIFNNDTKMRYFSLASIGNCYFETMDTSVQYFQYIVMSGGLRGSTPNESVSDTVWLYQPPSSWSNFYTPMPTPRYDCTSVVTLSGRNIMLYVIGGRSIDGSSLRTVERLRLAAGDTGNVLGGWEALPDMRAPRAGTGAAVIKGRVYVYGGEVFPYGGVGVPSLVASTEVYNPERGLWSYSVPPVSGAGIARFGICSFPSWYVPNATGDDPDRFYAPADTVWIYGGVTETGVGTQLVELFYEDQKNFGL